MKTMKKAIIATCCLVLLAVSAWAVDYSSMSTDDLSKMRGTMYNASPEEWSAFHAEWHKRLGQMTTEQRQQYMGRGWGMGKGKGMRRGMGCCPPCGAGAGAGSTQTPAAGAENPSTGNGN
jgi:hypothetical protein